jgi:hypothetical protein
MHNQTSLHHTQQWYSEVSFGGSNADGTPMAASALFIAYALSTSGGGSIGVLPLTKVWTMVILRTMSYPTTNSFLSFSSLARSFDGQTTVTYDFKLWLAKLSLPNAFSPSISELAFC